MNEALKGEVAERKRTEEALRMSEEKYRALFEESKDVVFISTPEGKILDINHAGIELFGYSSKEEILATSSSDLYVDPERGKYHHIMASQGYVKNFEVLLKRKGGQEITVLETTTAVLDGQGNIIAYRGIMRDVTHLKALEDRLRHAQKMEAIGRLAGGIAHDFNNTLMAITGFSELLILKLPGNDELRHDMAQILKAAEAGTRLTRQLLAFSRKQILEPKIVDLSHVVSEMKDMLQSLIGENIKLILNFQKPLGRAKADPGQIEQLLMNLTANARDAMPN
ncbi:MAG TPA: PAS domain S-box protein, partial [Acidobacteriota bacterium]|nr:PAS domain S-box protein [Acidobacteriota bacterium]